MERRWAYNGLLERRKCNQKWEKQWFCNILPVCDGVSEGDYKLSLLIPCGFRGLHRQ